MQATPWLILPGRGVQFPNPEDFDDEGLIAVGGDLSPERLLSACQSGIFPWFSEGVPPLWWSPNPRAVIEPEELHISRSMRRLLQRGTYRLSVNTAFASVMRGCAEEREDGTWILPEMLDAYSCLHRLGHAHSIEVWSQDELVGGLYGVQRGGLFAAESMFHRSSNASKVALVGAVRGFGRMGMRLFDVQFVTEHLKSLGAKEMSRSDYLLRLSAAASQSQESFARANLGASKDLLEQ